MLEVGATVVGGSGGETTRGGAAGGGERGGVGAVILFVWLVGIDAWVKLVARFGCCSRETPGAWDGPWTSPSHCEAVTVAGSLAIVPARRDGLLGLDLPSAISRQLGALALLGVVTIATILVARAQQRAHRRGAELKALAVAGAGAWIAAAPCLLGPGTSFTEFTLGGSAFGIGDLVFAVGAAWFAASRLRGDD